jgi:cephalosporin hydroxylase
MGSKMGSKMAGVTSSAGRFADRWAAERVRSMASRAGGPSDAALRDIADAFASLYQPQVQDGGPPPPVRATIVDQFHRLYYHGSDRTWKNTYYRGVAIQKCPLDLWVYQELVNELRPDLIIETGTAAGGSAYFFADLCDTLGSGRIVSVDIDGRDDRPAHERITYLTGSSIASDVVDRVAEQLPRAGGVLVVLDSDHTCEHVLEELRIFAPMVTVGSYVIVEDTNIGGHPAFPAYPAGPMEATMAFLPDHPEFVVDRACEKFLMTFNPGGYLRRVAAGPVPQS